jgi:GxxExxY protein
MPRGVEEIRGADTGLRQYPHREITEKIIGCAIAVHRELHGGYQEIIYENALAHEMGKAGLSFQRQACLPVYYDGQLVGEHRADIIVEGKVVVELKAVTDTTDQHVSQVMSTMRAAGVQVGLLINFNEARLVQGVQRIIM